MASVHTLFAAAFLLAATAATAPLVSCRADARWCCWLLLLGALSASGVAPPAPMAPDPAPAAMAAAEKRRPKLPLNALCSSEKRLLPLRANGTI